MSLSRAALASVALLAISASAHADDKSACIDAHVRAQELRQKGELRAARAELISCAAEACPPLVKRDCGQWALDVASAIPSVVVEARDERGVETSEVQVLVDGAPVAQRLDGHAIEVDPGEHVFRFVAPGGAAVEQRTVIREGERMRRLVADFQPARPTPPPERAAAPPDPTPAPSRPVLPWILGGVAVVAGASFATFAILGKSKESAMEDDCVPNCSLDDVGAMRTRYLIADISLGAAVVAGGLALYFALSHPSPGPATKVHALAWATRPPEEGTCKRSTTLSQPAAPVAQGRDRAVAQPAGTP